MFSSTRIKVLFTALVVVAIVGVAFFSLHTSAEKAWEKFRNHQPFYAEVPAMGVPALPAASTTEVALITATSTVSTGVPILVYHIVRPSYPTDSKEVKALAQTPEVFDAQMRHLADAGYHVISFGTLEDYLRTGTTTLPAHPIVITFDDGWGDQFKYAFPILQAHHYTATFFVFTNPLGTRGFMTWANLAALRDAGMTIGSHSRSHPFLLKITDPKILWNEIAGSKQTLEKNLGITVNQFAYPFGRYGAAAIEAVQNAGYTSARGDYMKKGMPQSASQIYELSAMNAPTSIEAFARRFPGAK